MAKYLYNGMELSALPEWDKGKYTHAIIYTLLITNRVTLCVSTKIVGDNAGLLFSQDESQYAYYDPESLEWGEFFSSTSSGQVLYSQVKWTNTDIYKPDGTLYLAASEPVPVVPTPPSAQTAFCIGKAFGRMFRDAMKPVAIPQTAAYCLYNGVKLPNIDTVWTDKETYPYANIFYVDAGMIDSAYTGCKYAELVFAANKLVVQSDGQAKAEEGKSIGYAFATGSLATDNGWVDGAWNLIGEANGSVSVEASLFTWASYDIINTTDNTVYLPASDPVPVYE